VRQQNAHGYAVHARLSVASAVSVEPGTTTTRRGGTPCPKRINAPARPHAQPRDGAARQRRGGNECRRLDANNEWRRQPPHIRLPSRSWSKRRLRSALVDLDARASLSQATGDRADDRDLQARSARSLLLRLQGSSARRRYRVPCKAIEDPWPLEPATARQSDPVRDCWHATVVRSPCSVLPTSLRTLIVTL
jgi:hypothetical protein